MPASLRVAQCMEIRAFDEHTASIEVVESGQAIEQRCLAGARRSHHSEELPGGNTKRQIAQRDNVATGRPVDFLDVLCDEDAVGRLRRGHTATFHYRTGPLNLVLNEVSRVIARQTSFRTRFEGGSAFG